MKLHEIMIDENTRIHNLLSDMLCHDTTIQLKFSLTPNGKVILEKHDETLKIENYHLINGKLPFAFEEIENECNFFISHCQDLISLEGMPKNLPGFLSLYKCPNLKSLDGISKTMSSLNTDIESLEGISDLIDKCWDGISIDCMKVKRGGLGLLLIKSGEWFLNNITEPFEIIEKYSGTDNIIECQSELIEAGYEDYAVL